MYRNIVYACICTKRAGITVVSIDGFIMPKMLLICLSYKTCYIAGKNQQPFATGFMKQSQLCQFIALDLKYAFM